jgi:hypothetical protein
MSDEQKTYTRAWGCPECREINHTKSDAKYVRCYYCEAQWDWDQVINPDDL